MRAILFEYSNIWIFMLITNITNGYRILVFFGNIGCATIYCLTFSYKLLGIMAIYHICWWNYCISIVNTIGYRLLVVLVIFCWYCWLYIVNNTSSYCLYWWKYVVGIGSPVFLVVPFNIPTTRCIWGCFTNSFKNI